MHSPFTAHAMNPSVVFDLFVACKIMQLFMTSFTSGFSSQQNHSYQTDLHSVSFNYEPTMHQEISSHLMHPSLHQNQNHLDHHIDPRHVPRLMNLPFILIWLWAPLVRAQDSSCVSVHTIYSNPRAFAAKLQDGGVATWGDSTNGGDSSYVSSELTSVDVIYSNEFAFAAKKLDGSVITWGYSASGGDSDSVNESLTSVDVIYSTWTAFAARKLDGSVVTWGGSDGGDSSAVSASLASGVDMIASTCCAFAAKKSDGSVITWGNTGEGGDSSSVSAALASGVVTVIGNEGAFAAKKSDGSVITWGNTAKGGDSSAVSASLTSVDVVYSNPRGTAFAAKKLDGSVVTWGNFGGDSSSVSASLTSNVNVIYASQYAFAALKLDGSVITWGESCCGGDSSSVSGSLTSNVDVIYSSCCAFAAKKADGSIVTWGDMFSGGSTSTPDSASPALLTSGVDVVYATSLGASTAAMAARKLDGSVVTWGDSSLGADSSAVAENLTGVVSISATLGAFAALLQDGDVLTWGSTTLGGDSSVVSFCATTVTTTVGGSVEGDPVTYFGTQRMEFVLPDGISSLISTPDMEIRVKPFYGVTGEQWIGDIAVYSLSAHSAHLVARVSIKKDIALFESSSSWSPGEFATLDVTIPDLHAQKMCRIPRTSIEYQDIRLTFSELASQFDRKGRQPPREVMLIESNFMVLWVVSASAMEFYQNGPLAAQHAHLDLRFISMRNESLFSGLLPELWGLKPMGAAAAGSLLK